jgi:DNA-binding transcriptional ArsR family regulator
VQPSPCYDFIVSLRALYNPGTYGRTRRWADAARDDMGAGLHDQGRPFFEGQETALGLGLLRLVPDLGAASDPADFLAALSDLSPQRCALLMLDTGETPQDTLDRYQAILDGRSTADIVDRDENDDWNQRCRQVLADPAACHEQLLTFLRGYLDTSFSHHVEAVREAVARAADASTELLAMVPTVSSIEALTRGYTLSEGLRLTRIVLAPSVFIYPFMASRVDEHSGDALIVYGIRNDELVGYDQADPEDVLAGLKALANPHRLRVLTLLRERPMLGSELVTTLGLSQPTVHHHLAHLRSSGLVRQERTRDGMRYSLRPDTARSFVSRLEDFLGIAE